MAGLQNAEMVPTKATWPADGPAPIWSVGVGAHVDGLSRALAFWPSSSTCVLALARLHELLDGSFASCQLARLHELVAVFTCRAQAQPMYYTSSAHCIYYLCLLMLLIAWLQLRFQLGNRIGQGMKGTCDGNEQAKVMTTRFFNSAWALFGL